MSDKILTRMGDGERVWMTPAEIREDIQAGTADAAKRAKIPELSAAEQEQLYAIMADPSRMVSVKPGEEVIVTDDGCSMGFYSGQDGGGVAKDLAAIQQINQSLVDWLTS